MGLVMLVAGCGQTGYLYLVMPANTFPPITHHPLPIPSAVTASMAPCVMVPTPTSNVAPVAAPFPGTVVEGVPYTGTVQPPSAAPASLTAILPACVIYPSRYPAHAPSSATQAVPAAATRAQP